MNRKKRFLLLACITLLLGMLFSVNVLAKGRKINKKKATITAGQTVRLSVSNAKPGSVKWKSSKSRVASVDKNGVVKGKKPGKAIITGSIGKKKYKCRITVKAVKVKKIKISGSKTVKVGSMISLSATVSPKNATNKKVTWKSGSKKVATVDKNGKVRGLKEGKTKITATAKDGSKISKSIVVQVVKDDDSSNDSDNTEDDDSTSKSDAAENSAAKQTETPQTEDPNTIPVTALSVSGDSSVIVGQTLQLKVIVTPSNATNKGVTWTSLNGSASVDSSGKVTALKEGVAVILVVTKDGTNISAGKAITVKAVSSNTNDAPTEDPQVRKELNEAKAKGPAAFISYCETARRQNKVDIGKYVHRYNGIVVSGDTDAINVEKEYGEAVETLYTAWLKDIDEKSKAHYFDTKFEKIATINAYVHTLYVTGKIQYGLHASGWTLTPTIAPLLQDGNVNGNVRAGTCIALSEVVARYARMLGCEVWLTSPVPDNPYHEAAVAVIDGTEYLFDPQVGDENKKVNGAWDSYLGMGDQEYWAWYDAYMAKRDAIQKKYGAVDYDNG